MTFSMTRMNWSTNKLPYLFSPPWTVTYVKSLRRYSVHDLVTQLFEDDRRKDLSKEVCQIEFRSHMDWK